MFVKIVILKDRFIKTMVYVYCKVMLMVYENWIRETDHKVGIVLIVQEVCVPNKNWRGL